MNEEQIFSPKSQYLIYFRVGKFACFQKVSVAGVATDSVTDVHPDASLQGTSDVEPQIISHAYPAGGETLRRRQSYDLFGSRLL
jgi:hypothetical protein